MGHFFGDILAQLSERPVTRLEEPSFFRPKTHPTALQRNYGEETGAANGEIQVVEEEEEEENQPEVFLMKRG